MSNTKGNQYPLWGINNSFQVFAVDHGGQVHTMSKENFAMRISVSEDGTVWVLSITPDPNGGGAKLYWSNGDSSWNEIDTPDPGGIAVAGGQNDNCFYQTFGGEIRIVDTNANNKVYYSDQYIVEFDYGGGMVWAIMPESQGGIPCLQYADVNNLEWKVFAGKPHPLNISANYQGDCYGVDNFNPIRYNKDGTSTGSAGSGLAGQALSMSFKSWSFALSTKTSADGNLIYEWQDEAGGTFMAMTAKANRIAASYYRGAH